MTIKTINDRVEQYKDVHWLLAADLSLELAKQVFDAAPCIASVEYLDDVASCLQSIIMDNISGYVFRNENLYWYFITHKNKAYATVTTNNKPLSIKDVMEKPALFNFSDGVVLDNKMYSGVSYSKG